MAAAALATAVMHQFLPASFRVRPHWMYPTLLIIFLLVLIIGDPGLIDRPRRWLHVTTGLMIGLITVVNAVAAGRLVTGILGKHDIDTAAQLLVSGGVVFLTNVIAFALWFWDFDGGGAAARAAGARPVDRAFVFPEMTLPADIVPAGWYPQFADYLSLSFSTAMTFGPADVSAVKPWAKLLMIVESLISLSLATLVVAYAVNIM
jgi:uncharacterized membrane protein